MNPKIFLTLALILFSADTAGASVVHGKASWYSSKDACGKKTNHHKGCPTASGKSIYELEKTGSYFVAVPRGTYAFGSVLKFTNRKNKKTVKARVVDTGGFKKYHRDFDLSKAAFKRIANLHSGVIDITAERIGGDS